MKKFSFNRRWNPELVIGIPSVVIIMGIVSWLSWQNIKISDESYENGKKLNIAMGRIDSLKRVNQTLKNHADQLDSFIVKINRNNDQNKMAKNTIPIPFYWDIQSEKPGILPALNSARE